MVKLSVITINYNDLEGLRKTFESVTSQSNRNFEYIVVDGGSTDGSVDFLKENDTQINNWISEKDSGIYNAMNKGIKAATGEYLMFINSGDFLYDNNVIEKVLASVDGQYGIYYGNLIYSLEGIPTQLWTPPDELSFSYFISDSLPHPASVIQKDLFEKHFYYSEDLRIVSDWEFFVYAVCKANVPYKHLDFTVADFDNSGTSSVAANGEKIRLEKMKVYQKHFPLFVPDLPVLEDGQSKRFKQVQAISQNKFKWTLLKGFLGLLGSKPKIRRYTQKL